MNEVKRLSKNGLFVKSIEAQRHIITDPNTFNPNEYAYEEGTPIDRVKQHNAFQILSQLDFPRDEVLSNDSNSRKYLDEVCTQNEDVETIIQALITYREEL